MLQLTATSIDAAVEHWLTSATQARLIGIAPYLISDDEAVFDALRDGTRIEVYADLDNCIYAISAQITAVRYNNTVEWKSIEYDVFER